MTSTFAFGLGTFGDVTVDDHGIPNTRARVLRDVVDEAVLADDLGLDAFGVREHHRADFAISAPEVALAAIAGRTKRILGRKSFTESYPLFGFDFSRYEELFEDRVALFVELLKGGPVTWSGTTRAPLAGAPMYPSIERGHLNTWIRVGGSPESVVRAARYGLPLTLAIMAAARRVSGPFVDLCLKTLEKLGHPMRRPLRSGLALGHSTLSRYKWPRPHG